MSKTLKDVLEEAFETGAEDEKSPELVSELKAAFSPRSLSTAFADGSFGEGWETAGIDMESMEKTFHTLSSRSDLCKIIADIIPTLYDDHGDLGSLLCEDEDMRILRILLILIYCPVLRHPNKPWSRKTVEIVGRGVLKLHTENSKRFNILVSWLKVEERIFKRAIFVFKCHCDPCPFNPTDVPTPLHALSLLNKVNETEGIVPYTYFNINFPDIHTPWHFVMMARFFYNTSMSSLSYGRRLFTWLNFPLALNTVSKWLFLQLETFAIQNVISLRVEVIETFQEAVIETFQEAWTNRYTDVKPSVIPRQLPRHSELTELSQHLRDLGLVQHQEVQQPSAGDIINQTHHGQAILQQMCTSITIERKPLIFDVDRHRIIQSAMENIRKYRKEEDDGDEALWLRPLQVNFEGEYAVDAGGPSKEFFYLLFKELTDTDKYKFFKRVDDNNIFVNEDFKQPEDMEAIGILFSLMIYNRVIVSVHFPEKVYEKLLSSNQDCQFSLDELESVDSAGAAYIREINSEGSLRILGNLKLLFGSFVRGFTRCMGRMHIHRLFRPEEFRTLIIGGNLDWKSFQKHTCYRLPYSEDHKVIMMFWKVFHSLPEEDRKKFYRFLTCAEYVPLNGFKTLGFTIQRLDTHREYDAEPAEIMPEVFTCPGFISMDLPEYKTEEDLKERLLLAMTVEGFHREAPREEPEQQLARSR